MPSTNAHSADDSDDEWQWTTPISETDVEIVPASQLQARANSTPSTSSSTTPIPALDVNPTPTPTTTTTATTTMATTMQTVTSIPTTIPRKPRKGETPARVLYNFVPMAPNELGVVAGEQIMVVAKGGAGWWLARDSQRKLGWVPERYVREQVGAAVEVGVAEVEEGKKNGEVEEDELRASWIAVTIGMRTVSGMK